MALAILYRQVMRVRPDAWKRYLDVERRMEEAEIRSGHPVPRRYRALFGGEAADTRVLTRIYESYAEFASLLAKRYFDDELQRLDAEKYRLLEWERDELYYVDSGSSVPRWMQSISRKPFDSQHIPCALPRPEPITLTADTIQKNIDDRKLRILYRHIQHVPRDRWAEKMEQERLSDEVEIRQGNPTPLRYRSMHSPEDSQTRVIEREYDSFEDLCKICEGFFSESSSADQAVMDAECRRQDFFTWEREEIYIVDSDSYTPDWMIQSP
jgi:hypothetical protein